MKATELMVNNWYESVKFKRPVRCELTDLYELCVRSDGAYDDPPIDEMFEPIPLTEEWLLKLGFVKEGRSYIMGVHNYRFSGLMKISYNKMILTWQFSIGKFKDITRVDFVHQLQNLYHALTGQELTYEKLIKPRI